MSDVIQIAKDAKQASREALQLSTSLKNSALFAVAKALKENSDKIISANKIDLDNAAIMLKNGELAQAAFNRLKLDENKLRDMIQGV